MIIFGSRRPFLKALLSISILILLVLTIHPMLLSVFRSFPLETLIFVAVFVVSGIAIFLYIGELVIVGWVVDFLSEIGMPKILGRSIPLDYEKVGEIIVITLRDNIATIRDCLSVQGQLRSLIDCITAISFSISCMLGRPRKVFVEFWSTS